MLAVSFLGTGQYQETTYVWRGEEGERSCRTRFVPVALARFFAPTRVVVLMTPTARAHDNWRTLSSELAGLVEPVEIPEGRSSDELWTLFRILVDVVPSGEELLLDVTHAFRSLPLFAVTAALALRSLRGVRIAAILYGAYEARDPATDRTPLFDLTPLVDLMDWLSGLEALERYGDGRLLGERLTAIHAAAWRVGSEQRPQHLKRIGQRLTELTEAVWLNRPREALRAAGQLTTALDGAKDELARWALPVSLVATRIRERVAPLAASPPDELGPQQLRAQLALVRYCLEADLVLQAVTLAREWLVSWYLATAMTAERSRWLDLGIRELAEQTLNEASRALRQGSSLARALVDHEVATLWDQLAQLRNDVAHCGMRRDAAGAQSIRQRAQELVTALERLLAERPADD